MKLTRTAQDLTWQLARNSALSSQPQHIFHPHNKNPIIVSNDKDKRNEQTEMDEDWMIYFDFEVIVAQQAASLTEPYTPIGYRKPSIQCHNIWVSKIPEYWFFFLFRKLSLRSVRMETPDSHGEAGGMWSNQMAIRWRQWQIHHRSHNNWSRHQSGDGLVRKNRVNFPNPRHPSLPLTSFINLRWHLQVGNRSSNKLWLDISQLEVSLLSSLTDILLSM